MTTEHAAKIRKAINIAFPNIKFSIYKEHHSSIHIDIMESEINFLQDENDRTHVSINEYYISEHYANNPAARDILLKVKDIANAGNHNKSDAMTDYFDVGWYVNMSIGKYDKPFKHLPPQPKKKPSTESTDISPESLEIVSYSDKSFAIFGNTYPIRKTLADLGGSFNKFLRYKEGKAAGWIFSKTRSEEVKNTLQLS